MVLFPNAKINLGLQIISKRPDNYHNICSCFYPIGLCDILELVPSQDFSFTSSGLPIPGSPQDNLCIQAYHLLCKDFSLPSIKLHLHKVIPMGAGLGGGSSDAAFLLKGLNELFELGLSETILSIYAKQLGSDCSFFIKNEQVLATEKGDVFSPTTIDLSGKHIVVIHPNIHVSTIKAYAGVIPQKPEKDLKSILKLPINKWKQELTNSFEESIFVQFPLIAQIKERLYDSGAFYASMTGSGSSVYGLFDENPAEKIKDFSNYFTWIGSLD
jgi:4-diphosphocytidyl-2-C-methyl-D-erythritol kinase